MKHIETAKNERWASIMKKDIMLTNSSQELQGYLRRNENVVLAEPMSDGVALIPVSGTTWLPLFIRQQGDELLVMSEEFPSEKSLWERVLNDDEEDSVWQFPAEEIWQLCEEDEEAIFKIVEILEGFKMQEECLVRVLKVLQESYPLERVLEDLLAMDSSELAEMFEEKLSDIQIMAVYQDYISSDESDEEVIED